MFLGVNENPNFKLEYTDAFFVVVVVTIVFVFQTRVCAEGISNYRDFILQKCVTSSKLPRMARVWDFYLLHPDRSKNGQKHEIEGSL